jgi:hypothetical protein
VVTLDGESRAVVTAQAPGAITITTTAVDDSGNATSVTKRIGVTDPTDSTAPVVEMVQPFDGAQLTFLADAIAPSATRTCCRGR